MKQETACALEMPKEIRIAGENMKSWIKTDKHISLDGGGPAEVAFDYFDASWMERPIGERFEHIAARYPNRLAVADYANRLSYEELRGRVRSLARRIGEQTPPAQPVGILMPHNALFPVAALACLSAGRPYVPIDLKYPAARIDSIIQEARLSAVILDEAGAAAQWLPADMTTIRFEAGVDDAARPAAASANTSASISVGSPAVILYTSGSTGKPKGICNDQRAILQRVAEATNSCHVNSNDRFILLSSPGTIAGVREMLAALLNGAALFVTDPQQDGVSRVLDILLQEKITIGYVVPSLLRMLLRMPSARAAFAHMRVLRVGGDITLASDLELFRRVAPVSCHFFSSFSSTETPAVFQWFVPPDWQPAGGRVPVGRARPGIDFMAVGEDGQPVAQGEIGELVVKSPYLAMGQWQNGRLSAGPFMTDPDDCSQRMLHTGDMVRLGAGGLWELIGRKDRMVKIRGQRIDAGEVEAALRSCSGVLDAAVIARRSGEEITALAAFVAPAAPLRGVSKAGLRNALKHALSARVPQFMHPAEILLIDSIPQLPGFKPDLRALEELDRVALERADLMKAKADNKMPAATEHAKTTAPDTRVRQAVKYAWSAVLGAKSYEANRAWNESNGDSLKALELWFYIEDKLGFKLPLDALDTDTRPNELIAAIEHHLVQSQQRPGHDDDESPLVFLMPGILSDDPPLARFRAACGDHLRFKIIDYPGWQQTMAAGGGFEAIADAVFEKICAEPACDIYHLAGYSFGGIVAFEVAQRLLASGRKVGFLGMLDSRRWDLTVPDLFGRDPTLLVERSNPLINAIKWSMTMLIRQRQFMPLSFLGHLLMLRPNQIGFKFQSRLAKELRYQALRQWKPARLDVPTTLFLSDAQWPGEPADHGWNQVCTCLKIVHIGGTHSTILESPQRESLCAHFLQAVTDYPGAPVVRCLADSGTLVS